MHPYRSIAIAIIIGVLLAIFALATPQLRILSSGEWNIASAKQTLTESDNNYIYLSGEVKNPGVYQAQTSTKVIDLIQSAGGFSENADIGFINKEMNLSEKVKDQQKIYIPSKNDTALTSTTQDTTAKSANNLTNLNTATLEELDTLPGVGQATAQKIIDNRPYTQIEDLLNIGGFGDKKFNDLKDLITVE